MYPFSSWLNHRSFDRLLRYHWNVCALHIFRWWFRLGRFFAFPSIESLLVLWMCVDKFKIVTRLKFRINDSKIGVQENYMFGNKKIVAKEGRRLRQRRQRRRWRRRAIACGFRQYANFGNIVLVGWDSNYLVAALPLLCQPDTKYYPFAWRTNRTL